MRRSIVIGSGSAVMYRIAFTFCAIASGDPGSGLGPGVIRAGGARRVGSG